MSNVEFPIKVTVPLIKTVRGNAKINDTFKIRLLRNQFPKPHYIPREIEQFNAVDVIHALVWYDESLLLYEDDHLLFKNHKQCVIYSEGVYDTQNYKIYTLIDALKTFCGLTFPQACHLAKAFHDLKDYTPIKEYCALKYPNAKKSNLSIDYNLNAILNENIFLSDNNNSYKTAYAILHNRLGIDRNIVSNFIHRGYLVMDNQFNLCYLSYENDNVTSIIKYLSDKNYLATETQTKRRNVGFRYAIKEEADYDMFRNVYVFENVIDLMSYLTLVNMELIPKINKASCLLAINGIGDGVLYNFLSEHPEVQTIYSCLQNDSAGIRASKALNQRCVVDMQPILRDYSHTNGYVRTWNAMLQNEHKKYSK